MTHKPKMILVEEQRDDKWREVWNALTWEQRRRMTVPELIAAMGELHVWHPRYKAKPMDISVVIPHRNLTGVHGYVIEHTTSTRRLWGRIKTLFAWALR